MPEVLTHFIFCRECFKQLKPEIQSIIHLEDCQLFLYAQTPNIPYYYHLKNPNAIRLGQLMHQQNIPNFILELITTIKAQTEKSKDLMTFLFGYITHYALDIALHPYIYYHSGYYNPNDPNTYQFKSNHMRFEKGIDVILASKYLAIKPHKYKIANYLEAIHSYPEEILTLLKNIIRKIYYTPKADKIFETSLKHFIRFHKKISFDPKGLKRKLYALNDRLIARGNRQFTKYFSYYQAYDIYIDYCNNSKQNWFHPITNSKSNLSLFELIYQAKKYAIRLIEYLYDYIYFNKTKSFEKFFQNINLETGSTEDPTKMQYFNVVFH